MLSLEDIEFIKILAHSDSIILEKGMNNVTLDMLNSKIGVILREYYLENTRKNSSYWTNQFEKVGISEDEGKSAIACARRLGLNIS